MKAARTVAVYGAYGHTGRFVVAELRRRGWTPRLCGRDARRLQALADGLPGTQWRAAAVEDPVALDHALEGVRAVLHCAGPFLDTAAPVLAAALRARVHYIDLAAEQGAALATFERRAEIEAAGVVAMPAMAFYGGLADLLATAAMDDWTSAERIDVAVALDTWHPTQGTRRTGERNHHPRLVMTGGELVALPASPPTRDWEFPAPFGRQASVALPLSEIVTISRHLRCPEVHAWMNAAPLRDLRDPDTPQPAAADADGRSAQRFALEVRVRRDAQVRSAVAQGRDIYAITAPLAVEALERIVAGQVAAPGVVAAGAAFDARDFLASLVRGYGDLDVAFARQRVSAAPDRPRSREAGEAPG